MEGTNEEQCSHNILSCVISTTLRMLAWDKLQQKKVGYVTDGRRYLHNLWVLSWDGNQE